MEKINEIKSDLHFVLLNEESAKKKKPKKNGNIKGNKKKSKAFKDKNSQGDNVVKDSTQRSISPNVSVI